MSDRLRVKAGKKAREAHKPSRATRFFVVWRKLRKSKLAVAGTGIVLFALLVALLAPIITPYDPESLDVRNLLSPPSLWHPFGTDALGRDMLGLVIYGARISLYVGVVGVFVEVLIGTAIGMIAGYFGGKIDEILMRITDVILTLPTLVLLILAVAMFAARGIHIIVLIMGLLGWPFIARMVRSEFLTLRETTYVEAAKSMGASNWRIMWHHILPNAFSLIIVLATADIPWFILWESSLSFLGFGDPSSPSWGILMQRGYQHLNQFGWWMITFPGIALLFVSLGFNLFGDGLREALDVTTRER